MRGNATAECIDCRVFHISIHASTWEATRGGDTDGNRRHISIHASTWEATYTESLYCWYKPISIHASTWEAASFKHATEGGRIISIHASTWEAALFLTDLPRSLWLFQFTPLHERQPPSRYRYSKNTYYFNSRLYMRGSNYVNPAMGRDYISIHASTWEAAPAKSFQTHWCVISIHASTWEAAVWPTSWKIRDQISIHASTWEAAEKGMV